MKKRLIIKMIREEREMTQQELADAININRATLSQIETGKVLPTLNTLLEIARTLDCKIIDLYDEQELELINETK